MRTWFIISHLLCIYRATVIVTWILLFLKNRPLSILLAFFLPVVFCHASESVCVLEFMGTPSGCHKIENCRCELKRYCCSLFLYAGSNMLVIVYIFLTFQPLFILTTAVCLCQYIYLHWQCGMLDHCDSFWYNVKWLKITSKRCFMASLCGALNVESRFQLLYFA